MQLVLWLTWCLVLGHLTAEENVVFVIGRGRDFVRQACNVIAAETFKFNTADIFEFGQSWVDGCVQHQASGVHMFQFGNESYRISEVLSREEPRSRLDKHTGDLENDVQNTSMAKFYVLHDVSQNEQHFLETLEYVSNFVGDVDMFKTSISVILVEKDFKVYNEETKTYFKLKHAKQLISAKQVEFVAALQHAFAKVKYSYNIETIVNVVQEKSVHKVFPHVGSLYIPTGAHFINWQRYLYRRPMIQYSRVNNHREFGFLVSNAEISDIPRAALQNSVRALYELLASSVGAQSVKLDHAAITMPRIGKLTEKLEQIAWELTDMKDSMFCDILETQVGKKSSKLLEICQRSEFITKYIGLRSLKYEFANYDLIKIYQQCHYNYRLETELENFIGNHKSKCSILKNTFDRTSYVLKHEYCYASLGLNEELQLLLKSQKQTWSKSTVGDTCFFSGAVINLNEVSTAGCTKTSVIARLAVVTNTKIGADMQVISPMALTVNSQYVPSLLLLENNLNLDVQFNVAPSDLPSTWLRQYLVELFSEEQCYGIYYQIKMAEFVSKKLIFDINSIDSLIEDYKYMFDNVTDRNQLALQVYSEVLLRYYFANVNTFTADDKAVVANILLAYNSLIVPLKNNLNLIVNQERYVTLVDEKIKELQSMKTIANEDERLRLQIAKINKTTEDFKKILKDKCRECKAVSDNLVVVLSKQMAENNKILGKVLEEVVEVEAKQENKVDQLKQKRKEILQRMEYNIWSSIFQVFSAIVTVFVPPAGAALGALVSIDAALEDANANQYDTSYQIPTGILHQFKEIEIVIKTSYDLQLETLKTEVSKYKNKLERVSGYDQKMAFIEKIENQIRSVESNRNSDSFSVLLEIRDKFDNFKAVHSRKRRDEESDIADGIKASGEHISNGIRKHTELKNELPSEEDIEAAEEDLQRVLAFRDRIFSKVLPFVLSFNKYMGDTANSLHHMSKPLLVEMKLFMKSKFRAVMFELQDMTEGFMSNKEVHRNAEDLQEVLSAIFELNQELQDFEHEQKNVDLLRDLFTPVILKTGIQNENYLKFVKEAKNNAISMNIYHEVMKVIYNFKQWVFPFAPHFATELNMLENLNSFKTIAGKNIDEYVTAFKSVYTFITKYKSEIIPRMDKYIKDGVEFNSNLNTGAFFSWQQTDYRQKINDLLSGKEVVFQSHIPDKSQRPEQAIKFKSISLNLVCRQSDTCKDFNETLSKFEMHMAHLGYSEYRCKDKVFVINTAIQTLEYSFEKVNGAPNIRNRELTKLGSGDETLSPYTLWKFHVVPTNEYKYSGLLDKYKDLVDLELVGTGTYAKDKSQGDQVCLPNLPFYYRVKNY